MTVLAAATYVEFRHGSDAADLRVRLFLSKSLHH